MPADDPHVDRMTGRELLSQAQTLAAAGDHRGAARRIGLLGDVTAELPTWLAASRVLDGLSDAPWARREARVAILGSHTTSHLAALLPVAAARHGLAITVYEAPYGQYQQEVLDESSGLYAFGPDVVLLAVDQRELHLPDVSATPEEDLRVEVERWTSLWSALRTRLGAVVVQHTFVPTAVDPMGNLAVSLAGSRRRQLRRLNLELGDRAGDGVLLVDAEMVAAAVGLGAWDDARYWFLSKHAVGMGAVPALARATVAVMAAALGLTRKVVVVDLDNTLWGGVIGEDGLAGIVLGGGPVGEAHQALQEYLRRLRQRGVLLAVVSKNNEADAKAPFLKHPDMRLTLEDFAAFRATWEDKATQIRNLAEELSLALDSFVFVDDNPFEREGVRQALPDVDVVPLPEQVSGYVRALASTPGLEPASLTAEDMARTQQYRARARAAESAAGAASREEFLDSLEMVATLAPIDEGSLDRVVQLLGKTNQFNTTTRRHGHADVQRMIGEAGSVGLTLRLRDRFADHGLVGVLLAVPDGADLRVDSWLMSCRVLGRDVELPTMRVLTDLARARGRRRVIGEFVASERNAPAAAAYAKSGFSAGPDVDGVQTWVFDLSTDKVPDPGLIDLELLGDLGASADEGTANQALERTTT